MNQETYFKTMRSNEAKELMKRPNEYILLALIAYRAKRTSSFSALGLEPGEALIGDFKSIGLTQQKYRTAKKNLEKWKFITTKATNKGTVAKLINSTIFDINIEATNEQNNETITGEQRTGNDRVTTNKNDKKEKNIKKGNTPPISPPLKYPDWLNLSLWKEFKKYRTKIKSPLTTHAEKLCLADLKKVIDSGYYQKEVINQTIMSGKWKSFYPVRDKTGKHKIEPTTYAQAQDAERRTMVRMLKEMQNDGKQESDSGGTIKAPHLLPHGKTVA